MDWQPLRDYLEQQVVAHMRRPERGAAWLDRLADCEDGVRLAVCIAIDIRVGSVEPRRFAEVLDALPAAYADARAAFDEAAEPRLEADALIAASRYGDPPLEEGDRYLRVMTLRTLNEVYFKHRYHTLDRVDERELLRSLHDGMPMGEVEKVWRGRKPVVWVVSQQLLEKLRLDAGDQGATAIADALGLFPDPECDTRDQPLIGVRYPEGWAEARLRKPTTFDAWWQTPGHYYLSWPLPEGWGWTWSCSGTRDPLRERVHPALNAGLTDEFTLVHIGVAALPDADAEALLNEALRRLDQLWNGGDPADAAAA